MSLKKKKKQLIIITLLSLTCGLTVQDVTRALKYFVDLIGLRENCSLLLCRLRPNGLLYK